MNEHPPFIKLWRSIRDHRYWYTEEERPATRCEAWIDLLMDAAYRDHSIYFKGRLFHLKIGELVTSERDLSEQWRWSRTKVRRFLNDAETCSEVTRIIDQGVTHLTVLGMRRYMNARPTKETSKRTNRRPVEDQSRTTIEESKEVEKVKKNIRGDDAAKLYDTFQTVAGRLGKPPNMEERKLCVELCTEAPWQELAAVVRDTVKKAKQKVHSIRYCESAMREKIHELRKTAAPDPEVARLVGVVNGIDTPGGDGPRTRSGGTGTGERWTSGGEGIGDKPKAHEVWTAPDNGDECHEDVADAAFEQLHALFGSGGGDD